MSKKKAPKVTFSRRHVSVPAINADHKAQQLEHFAGRKGKEPLYSLEGTALDVEAVMVKTPTSPFSIYVKFGDDWFEIMSVGHGDPAIDMLNKAGHITKYGYSPQQIENQRAFAKRQEDHEARQRAISEGRAARRMELREKEARKRANAQPLA